MTQDTIKLLRECDAGVEMGIAAIDDVLDYAHAEALRGFLTDRTSPTNSASTSEYSNERSVPFGSRSPSPT